MQKVHDRTCSEWKDSTRCEMGLLGEDESRHVSLPWIPLFFSVFDVSEETCYGSEERKTLFVNDGKLLCYTPQACLLLRDSKRTKTTIPRAIHETIRIPARETWVYQAVFDGRVLSVERRGTSENYRVEQIHRGKQGSCNQNKNPGSGVCEEADVPVSESERIRNFTETDESSGSRYHQWSSVNLPPWLVVMRIQQIIELLASAVIC